MKSGLSSEKLSNGGYLINGAVLKFVGFLLSITAAYFLTIQSLKVELAGKADSDSVAELNSKLTNIEAILREGVIDKEAFFTLASTVDKRLTKIELLLENQSGR